MAPLNSLPTVIDGPGLYETRSGGHVEIREVKDKTDPTTTSFDARGGIFKMFRGKYRARGHNIWHVSGRFEVMRENPLDIIAKAERF